MCLPLRFLRKIQLFCCFVSNFWQFQVIFKKSASCFPVSFFEAFFGLNSLYGPQLTTYAKKSHSSLFWGTMFERKNTFFRNLKKYVLPQKVFRVYHSKEREKSYNKDSKFLTKFMSTFCQKFVNTLISNCHWQPRYYSFTLCMLSPVCIMTWRS